MIIGYYPGCSLSGGGIELDLSVKALVGVAGVTLREIDDWNCCGASAAHSTNHDLSVALPYRVLSLAEEQGLEQVVAPCAACFSRLKGTHLRLERSDELARKMADIVGRSYNRTVRVLSLTDFVRLLLAGGLADKLTHKLTGLKVAAYYGCLLSRLPQCTVAEDDIEDAERPTSMDAAIRATGAEPIEWNFATECCGGGLSLSKTDAVVRLSGAILADAKDAGAAAVVTGCPMCHSNLDMRQGAIHAAGLGGSPDALPILYLSELLGLAAGVPPEQLGLNRHFTDAMRLTRGAADEARSAPAAAGGGGS
ncbi:MAG: CoB--CoM heterodisulfide reductase iron-sulfur subunit B family protein [Phycisphaerae bacterium]|nr:CoB--CoM heterodisulfide reductase iron-sulfur subunit B family protein [Phycisphaerae bacterium]